MWKWAALFLTRCLLGPLCRCSSLISFLLPASSGEAASPVFPTDGCREVSFSDLRLFSPGL